jgi:hypothetical protein
VSSDEDAQDRHTAFGAEQTREDRGDDVPLRGTALIEHGAAVTGAGDGLTRLPPALAAHQAATPARRVDPGIARAVERQSRAMRELSARAFPKAEAGSGDQPAPIEVACVQRRREADATSAAALCRD